MPVNATPIYSAEDLGKIMGPKGTPITEGEARSILTGPDRSSVRIYGVLSDGQLVKVASEYYLDKYDLAAVWVSGTTVADMIRKA